MSYSTGRQTIDFEKYIENVELVILVIFLQALFFFLERNEGKEHFSINWHFKQEYDTI